MKKKYINFVKIVIFTLVLLLILRITPKILGISAINGIENEPEKTIDYLVIGDSLAYRSISPMQIFKEKGYTGYNLGKSAQYFQNGFYSLTEVLERQKPKIVFVETNFIFRERNIKSEMEQAVSFFIKERLIIFENHNQWKSLLKSDGHESGSEKKESKDSAKGFRIKRSSKNYVGVESLSEKEKKEKKEISVLARYYLDKLVELSQEQSFDLVFYSAPSPKNWTHGVHNSIEKYTKANNIEYIDFNLSKKELKIDWSKDTYDQGDHLNLSGATKLTHNIGIYLYNLGILVDHRNDPAYKNWEELLEDYD